MSSGRLAQGALRFRLGFHALEIDAELRLFAGSLDMDGDLGSGAVLLDSTRET